MYYKLVPFPTGLEFPDRPISINPLCQILSVLCEISLDLDLEDPRSVQISLLMSELQLESAKIPMHQLKRNKGEDERRKAKLRSLKVAIFSYSSDKS